MASFVVNVGMSPSDYYALTLGERDAISRAARKRKH
jgi:hypothetical protein